MRTEWTAIRSRNDADGTAGVNQVALAYDAWGPPATSWQAHAGAAVTSGQNESPKVQYAYEDGAGTTGVASYVRLHQVTYPGASRSIYYNYPAGGVGAALSRLDNLAADSSGTNKYAQYTYLGAGTVVKVAHPAVSGGLNLTYGTAGTAGLDQFGRVVQQFWRYYGGTPADRDKFTYAYDRNGNRLFKRNPLTSDKDELYT